MKLLRIISFPIFLTLFLFSFGSVYAETSVSTSTVALYENTGDDASQRIESSYNHLVQTLGTNLSGTLTRIDIETSNVTAGFYGSRPNLTLYECNDNTYGYLIGSGCINVYSGPSNDSSPLAASIQSFYIDSIILNPTKYYFFISSGNNQFNALPTYYGSSADTVDGGCYQYKLGGVSGVFPCTTVSDLYFRLYGITKTIALTGNSNVLFLPGLEASRLYAPDYNGGTDKLWEPNGNDDLTKKLFMNPDGSAVREDIYTKDVIDNAYLPNKGNVYKSFLEQLSEMKNTDNIIADYSVVPYDWRLSLDDILKNGAMYSNGRLYYSGLLGATSTPYIIAELRRLARTSRSGKVTIVAHSNGGLVAKALTNALGTEASQLIDKIIFVAVPQVGTPKAVGAILHGFDQALPIKTLSAFGITDGSARELAQNMPSAYNLLPSGKYFTYVDEPVITFDNDPLLASWRQKYGVEIHSGESLHNFLVDTARTILPTSENIKSPIIGNADLLSKSESVHTELDNWVPPAGIQLTEIAGWGEETLKTIVYYQGSKTSCSVPGDLNTCTTIPALEYSPKTVIDGDGTVVVPSALWVPASTGVEKYWVNLDAYNTIFTIERKHADILEVPQLRSFIKEVVVNGPLNDLSSYKFISTSTPIKNISGTQLHFTLHSPLSLNLYDSQGNHTGFSTTTNSLEENIPDSQYLTFGEVSYISVPSSANLHLVMNGYANGSFTLDLAEVSNDSVLASTTFSGIPTTEHSVVTMNMPTGKIDSNISNLHIDVNGDGTNMFDLVPKLNDIVTIPKPKIPLTIIAQNKNIILGSTIPPLTANLSGFVSGETATSSDMTGSANCTTTATSQSPIGIYPITCTIGTLASSKYSFVTFLQGTLTIQYRFDGFSQPINDTTHQVGQSLSVFKAGSTVPVKFQIKKVDGTIVQALTLPVWLTPQKGSAMTASVDESVYSDPGTSGNAFKLDTASQQYSYNWSTKGLASGYWYRISVKMDDGSIYNVIVGLK